MKNNRENAKKFLEEKGMPAAGPNFENRIIETMVEYANSINYQPDGENYSITDIPEFCQQ